MTQSCYVLLAFLEEEMMFLWNLYQFQRSQCPDASDHLHTLSFFCHPLSQNQETWALITAYKLFFPWIFRMLAVNFQPL